MTRKIGGMAYSHMGMAELKRYAWQGLAGAYHWSGAARVRQRGTVAILTYHRVLSEQELATEVVQPGMYVRDDVFERHVEYLREHFQILSLDELLEMWRVGKWDCNAAYCVLTFDDGWLDNYKTAFPILKRSNVPATIFLPTDFIGTSCWFWPERLSYLLRAADLPTCSAIDKETIRAILSETLRNAGLSGLNGKCVGADFYDEVIDSCKALDIDQLEQLLVTLSDCLGVRIPEYRVLLNWDEVREMSEHGITFGSHSCSHQLLTVLSKKEVRDEAAQSYEKLRKSGAAIVPVFCYPNGNYDAGVQAAVKDEGYQAALSVIEGLEGRQPSDLFALRRISLHNDISNTRSLFAFALSGFR